MSTNNIDPPPSEEPQASVPPTYSGEETIISINTTPPPPLPPTDQDAYPTSPAPGAYDVGGEDLTSVSVSSASTAYSIIGVMVAAVIGGGFLMQTGIIETPESLSGIQETLSDLQESVTGLIGDDYAFDADGPFAYQFTEGEHLNYRLDSWVKGKGVDMGVDSDIGLVMSMVFDLDTLHVDDRGFGTLELNFENVQMTGNFMGEEVRLYQTGDTVEMQTNALETLSTEKGDSIASISQLEFFNEPVTMVVSPDGVVREISGPDGFDTILSPADALAPAPLEGANLEVGDTWTSEFNMPVPGLAIPAEAVAYNTFVRYDTIGTREVAVIHQQIQASQEEGEIASPTSVLGENLNLTMPSFDVSGENWIYFDINDGKLVRTEMNLFFSLELGESGDALKKLLGQYEDAFSGLDNPGPGNNEEEDGSLLQMGVEIGSTLFLVE